MWRPSSLTSMPQLTLQRMQMVFRQSSLMAHLLYSVHLGNWIVQQENEGYRGLMQTGDCGVVSRLKMGSSCSICCRQKSKFIPYVVVSRREDTIGSFVPSKFVFRFGGGSGCGK